ncbi:MAG: aminopeptidase P family protein, partial [Vicinamibacterales bacterium]
MRIDRRAFLGSSAAAAVGATACNQAPPAPAASTPAANAAPPSIASLKPMTSDVTPITAAERGARLEKARKLMV